MRQFWKTYVAVALLLALGAYAYFIESERPAGDEEVKESAFGFEQDQIQELSLLRPGEEAVRLRRSDEGWSLFAPLEASADASQVDSLLGDLESLEIDAVVVEGETEAELVEFGLAPPKLTLEMRLEGASAPLKLMLGDQAPAGGGTYARVPSQGRIFTIASYLEAGFDRSAFELRDQDVLHFERDQVRTLEIQGPEGRYALLRHAEEEWRFGEPVATPAGRWAVDGLLGSLENLKMEEVAAERASDAELGRFGFEPARRSVTLGLSEDRSATLQIGASAPEDRWFAREAQSRLVAVISGRLVEELAKGQDGLRAKRLLDIATYDVTGFDVSAPQLEHSYDRTGGDEGEERSWTRAGGDESVASEAVQDALFQIGGVEAQEFIDQPASLDSYGLVAPTLRVNVRFEEADLEQWFEIGEKDGAYFARRIADDALLVLEAGKAEELVRAFTEL